MEDGNYRNKMKKYRASSNDPTSNAIDFATMNKDKRYYSRLKAADRASQQAASYQDKEDAKMDALKQMFGLDGAAPVSERASEPLLPTTQSETPLPARHPRSARAAIDRGGELGTLVCLERAWKG